MAAAKPAMRNLLLNKTKKDFVIALVFSLTLATGYKFGVQERRRALFDDFHKNYDANKDYERMKKAGVFQFNIHPDEEE